MFTNEDPVDKSDFTSDEIRFDARRDHPDPSELEINHHTRRLEPMNEQIFYKTQRVLAPIPNQRGQITKDYIIAVYRRDPEGKEYTDLAGRAQDVWNLFLDRDIDDPVNFTEIDEKDLPPKEKLKQAYFRHDSFIYEVLND